MSVNVCLLEMETAAGRPLTPSEKKELSVFVDDLIERTMRDDRITDKTTAIEKTLTEFTEDMEVGVMIERRNALLNKKAQLDLLDYILGEWGDDPGTGLLAFLGGVAVARKGARNSVAAGQEGLANRYVDGFLSRLMEEGVYKDFVSGTMDQYVFRAMHQLGSDTPNFKGIPEPAVKIAQVLDEFSELTRKEANEAGAFIKKLPGRVIKQTHDIYKIKGAGWDAWRDYALEHLDWDRTMPDLPVAKRAQALKEMHAQLESGVHVKFGGQPMTGFKGFANVGKRMSHERVLHWKSPDAEFGYHQKFGAGTLSDAVIYGFENMGQNTALMLRLGPNAEMNLDEVVNRIKKSLRKRTDGDGLARFDASWKNTKRTLWPNITGESSIPGNAMLATVSSVTRSTISMAKLGGALISGFSDIPVYASEIRYQGGGFLSGMGEALGGLGKGMPTADQRELLSSMGVMWDGLRSAAISRYDAADRLPGTMTRLTQKYFKLNGLRWWTDRLRTNFALSQSHRLATYAEKGWEGLSEGLQRALTLYDIGADEWDVLRAGKATAADDRMYLTPESLEDLGDDVFAAYLTKKGFATPTKAKINAARKKLQGQFRTYFSDRATHAVLEGDARTRAILLRGTQAGTVEGELFRQVALLKSFTTAFLQKVVGRELYGYSAKTQRDKHFGTRWFHALKQGNGEVQGMANLILWTTAFGYLSMSTKDLLKGKKPRDPMAMSTWSAAMVQGGGLGIYGDFLFGEMKNRFGGTPLETLAGPWAGVFNDTVDIAQRLRDGDDTAAQAFRFAINNTPFMNLFYVKPVLDYLILYEISERMNPGYLARMERRIKKENAQEFFLKPTSAIPYGGGRPFEGVR